MTGLNWFQARDLALQGRCIRRDNWRHWLIYRGAWIIVTTAYEQAGETRHVALCTEFTDAEFLAKDWTDETWEDGSYVPCTQTAPSAVTAPNASGGSGSWTFDERCPGEGAGGNVVLLSDYDNIVEQPGTPPGLPDGDYMQLSVGEIALNEDGSNGYAPCVPLVPPEEGTCWPDGAPTQFVPLIKVRIPVDLLPPSFPGSGSKGARLIFWVSTSGVDFSAIDEDEIGAITGSQRIAGYPPTNLPFHIYVPLDGDFAGSPAWSCIWSDYAARTGYTYTPGSTLTVRVAVLHNESDEVVLVQNLSYTLPPLC